MDNVEVCVICSVLLTIQMKEYAGNDIPDTSDTSLLR